MEDTNKTEENGKNNTKPTIMLSKDTVAASMAQCYVTIGESRYNFMQAINLEAKFEKTKTEVPILGRTGKGNKACGWKGTGSATFHYNTSVFRKLMENYKDGTDTYFDIQIINCDPSSAAKEQKINLIGCNIDSGILAKFDADGEYLDEEMEFTFEDFNVEKEFEGLVGFDPTADQKAVQEAEQKE